MPLRQISPARQSKTRWTRRSGIALPRMHLKLEGMAILAANAASHTQDGPDERDTQDRTLYPTLSG